jgi:hypothetical protein
MHFLIIIFALIFFAFACPQIVECKSSQFVRTCYCGSEKSFKLCLIGKFPPSTTINLLSQKDSKTCKATTREIINYTEYPYDVGESLKLTYVDTTCDKPVEYTLAYLENDVSEYQLTTIGQETNSSTIDKVDKMIRDSNLMKESEVFFSTFLLEKPILYIPVPEYSNTYIVQYVIHPYPRPVKYGPLFFYTNNRVIKIDSEAEIIKTFKLNGRYFVLFDHSCWEGCGNVYTTLLEIKNNEFIKIFEDGTWAD